MVFLAQEKSLNMSGDLNGNVNLNGINPSISDDINGVYKEESVEEEGQQAVKTDGLNEKKELNAQCNDLESKEPNIDVDGEKGLENTAEGNKENEQHKKGILKYQRTYSNKHVGFNMDLEFVPFDESKDYTIEIQIVEQMPKRIVSYAALFAQQKEAEKRAAEEKEKEEQKRQNKAKRKRSGWKKLRKHSKQLGEIHMHDSIGNTKEDQEQSTQTEEDSAESSEEEGYLSDKENDQNSDGVDFREGEQTSESEDVSSILEDLVSEPLPTDLDPEAANKSSQNRFLGTEFSEIPGQCKRKEKPNNLFKENNGIPDTFSASSSLKVQERKERSHSLTELECPRLSRQHVDLKVPYGMHLMLTRQQEGQQHYR